MKDPAFLFYSKDFYEGTRMMLPEERACYMDLLIYQHQNGIIPNDIKRIIMYCSGCSEETVKNVLNQKFDQTINGWFNLRLDQTVKERSEYKPKKIASACLAGLISTSKLTKREKEKIKKSFRINEFIQEKGIFINDEILVKSKVKEWFNQLVNQMVDNLENANINASINKKEEGMEEEYFSDYEKNTLKKRTEIVFEPPNLEEVQNYCNERNNGISANSFVSYYQSIGWMIGKNKMKDWKSAVRTWEQKQKEETNEQKKRQGGRSLSVNR